MNTLWDLYIFVTLYGWCNVLYYIMAGRAFAVAKEDFIMEPVVFWHCDNG